MSSLKQLAAKIFGSDPVFARQTFGGIQPLPFKEHSLRSRIMSTPIPPMLTIPVAAHGAGEITLLVSAAEKVAKYQKLAVVHTRQNDNSYVVVHAPTSGVIDTIENSAVADHSRQQQICIKLVTDGHDRALTLTAHANYSGLSRTDTISLIRDAGVVGMGGAGFPAADKLSAGLESEIDYLIINAAECEPYITADEALLRERADKVILGAQILKQACGALRCIVAIEESMPDAIDALIQAMRSDDVPDQSCELILIPSKYPAGSERQLIQCITGREIPSGQHPTENGVVMHNVGTAYAAYEAVVEGKPSISRFTTLCGQALKTPKNFETLIGTPADYLFNLCGIDASAKQISIVGGSLMGGELSSDRAAISKTTNCLIAASMNELQEPQAERACIRCGLCADACPSKLLPQQLYAFCKSSDTTQLLSHGLLDCIECGACDYVCPSHIPLVSTYKQSKETIKNRDQSKKVSSYWQQRFQYRQYRVKKEKDQALSKKPTVAEKNAPAVEHIEPKNKEPDFISKEQASLDIAAAVARVKARRNEKEK